MKIRKPLFSVISSAPQQNKPATFGSYRAERMGQRLEKAISERKTLARAEAAASDPLNAHIQNRGNLVGNKIGRLQQEISAHEQEKKDDQ